jgi:hypothetical protein
MAIDNSQKCTCFSNKVTTFHEVANFRQLKQGGVFFFSGKFPHCGGDKKKTEKIQCATTSVVQRISCGKNVPKSPDFEEKNSEIALFIIRDNVGGVLGSSRSPKHRRILNDFFDSSLVCYPNLANSSCG